MIPRLPWGPTTTIMRLRRTTGIVAIGSTWVTSFVCVAATISTTLRVTATSIYLTIQFK
jgi:hypothetical protein